MNEPTFRELAEREGRERKDGRKKTSKIEVNIETKYGNKIWNSKKKFKSRSNDRVCNKK